MNRPKSAEKARQYSPEKRPMSPEKSCLSISSEIPGRGKNKAMTVNVGDLSLDEKNSDGGFIRGNDRSQRRDSPKKALTITIPNGQTRHSPPHGRSPVNADTGRPSAIIERIGCWADINDMDALAGCDF